MPFESIAHAFHNNNPLDLQEGVMPFGPEPLRNDAFYFSSPEIFSKSGANITLVITLSEAPSLVNNPSLTWEYFDGRGWKVLPITSEVIALSATISFIMPDDVMSGEYSGVEGYWVRSRLVAGDFGRLIYSNDCDTGLINISDETLIPPKLVNIKITYETTSLVTAEHLLLQNNLDYLNHTQASQEKNANFKLYENAKNINGYLNTKSSKPAVQKALYLGFSKPFDVRPLSVFVDAEEQDKNTELDFEVLAKDDWRKVNSIDETNGFHRRGFAQVFVDFQPRLARLMGQESYWLRVRPHQASEADWTPKLRGIFINAVRAEQAKSVKNEVLGSSAGEPNFTVSLSNRPVLASSLELRIRENLSDEERQALLSETADLADHELPVRNFEEPNLSGDWVLWKAVDSFIGHGPENRVYRLDPVKGEIQFGNARQGKIPPAGSGHIRAIYYQTGGGIRGNVGAYTITDLKSAVEGVENVANPVQAAGGTDAPSIEEQIAQAPARLRRAGKAMTPRDIEALAVSTSPDLVRARCLFPDSPEAPVQVAIVVRNGERCPVPRLAEKDALAKLIRYQSWGGLQRDDVKVSEPRYVPVVLSLSVFPDRDANAAILEQAATNSMHSLFDPVDGGPNGEGWLFGRRIWESDILRSLAKIPSFDSVLELQYQPKIATDDFDHMPELGMICAMEEDIQVSVEPRSEVN